MLTRLFPFAKDSAFVLAVFTTVGYIMGYARISGFYNALGVPVGTVKPDFQSTLLSSWGQSFYLIPGALMVAYMVALFSVAFKRADWKTRRLRTAFAYAAFALGCFLIPFFAIWAKSSGSELAKKNPAECSAGLRIFYRCRERHSNVFLMVPDR